MELIFEFIFELIAEVLVDGGIEVSTNKKISKWIRYPILFILISLFLAVEFLVFFVGISIFEKSALGSILIIFVGIILFIGVIFRFRKLYIENKK